MMKRQDERKTQIPADWGRRFPRSIGGNPRHGQSTLEYILVLVAILVAVIAAAGTFMKPAVEKGIQDSTDTIKAATGKVKIDLGL